MGKSLLDVIGEEGSHFRVYNGKKEFKVAKHGLSDSTIKHLRESVRPKVMPKMQHFAQGGGVYDPDTMEAWGPRDLPAPEILGDPGYPVLTPGQMEAEKAAQDAAGMGADVGRAAYVGDDNLLPPTQPAPPPEVTPIQNPDQALMDRHDPFKSPNDRYGKKPGPNDGWVDSVVPEKSPPLGRPEKPPSTTVNPNNSEVDSLSGGLMGLSGKSYGAHDYGKEYRAAEEKAAKAAEKQGADLEVARNHFVGLGNDIRLQHENDLATMDAGFKKDQEELKGAIEEYKAGKLDPNRIWGTGASAVVSRIGGALSMALGAYGAAITKSPNFAKEIIDDAIARDMKAQEFDQKRKGELIGMMTTNFRDTQSKRMAELGMKNLFAAEEIDRFGKSVQMGQDADKLKTLANQYRVEGVKGMMEAQQSASSVALAKAQTAKVAQETALQQSIFQQVSTMVQKAPRNPDNSLALSPSVAADYNTYAPMVKRAPNMATVTRLDGSTAATQVSNPKDIPLISGLTQTTATIVKLAEEINKDLTSNNRGEANIPFVDNEAILKKQANLERLKEELQKLGSIGSGRLTTSAQSIQKLIGDVSNWRLWSGAAPYTGRIQTEVRNIVRETGAIMDQKTDMKWLHPSTARREEPGG
jgi:hypothetical protein